MCRKISINAYTLFSLSASLAVSLLFGSSLSAGESEGLFVPENTAAKNLYGGIAVGPNKSDAPDSNQDGSVTGVDKDETDITTSIFLGYQIVDNVAVQGGYQNLGESDFKGTSSGGPSWSAGPVRTKQESDGWDLGIMGRWPVSERWYVLGYIGMFWWENKETYYESGFVSSANESGSDFTYALGFEFDHGLKDRIVYRFMGSHNQVGNDDYDVNSVSAAIVYRFP